MTISLAVAYASQVSVVETFNGSFVNPKNNNSTFDQLSTALGLTGTTTVPVSKWTGFSQALTAGAATIDLTNMPGITPSEVVNGTGLRCQIIKVQNPATNANSITFKTGGTNGHTVFGSTFSVTLAPGDEALLYGNNSTVTIASGNKTFDITGTGAQALNFVVVMG